MLDVSLLPEVLQSRPVEAAPLYDGHPIPGTDNLADILTKPTSFASLSIDAELPWKDGLDWMRLPSGELPHSQPLEPLQLDARCAAESEFEDLEAHLISETRQMLLSSTDPEGVGVAQVPHGDPGGNTPSCHPEVSMAHPKTLGWFPVSFPSVFLGWTWAMKRLQIVHEAILCLLPADCPPGCPVCDGSFPAAVEEKRPPDPPWLPPPLRLRQVPLPLSWCRCLRYRSTL